MNQQPDKFFRDKLQSLQTPPPSGAWNRIEANLDKKNNKLIWLRVAASLLLFAIASYLLWPVVFSAKPAQEIAKQTVPKQKSNVVEKKDTVVEKPAPSNSIAKAAVEPKANKSRKRSGNVNNERKQEEKVKALQIENELAQQSTTDVAQRVTNETMTEGTTSADQAIADQPVAIVSNQPRKVKIVYSAQEVDNKYLDKNALAEATSDDKKPSTLKKIFDKAYDLKYNQDPFGDLRDKKNEILALNFRTDKQRSDKK